MLKGIAQVLYYKFWLRVKWQPGFNPFTKIYSLTHNGTTIRFHQSPFYDFEYDDQDYLKYIDLSKPVVFVDAGSFIGTLAIYLATFSPHNYIIAIEPDPTNFATLVSNIKLNNLSNILPLQVGLWKESGYTKFNSGLGEMSKVSATGNKIPVFSLDDLAKKLDIPITHIKMDIEGAEIEALQGATQIIKKVHPQFIIASYHLRDNQPTSIKVEKLLKSHYLSVNTIKDHQQLTIAQ